MLVVVRVLVMRIRRLSSSNDDSSSSSLGSKLGLNEPIESTAAAATTTAATMQQNSVRSLGILAEQRRRNQHLARFHMNII